MQDETAPTRVKVPEAARVLGVSVDTVRRRIRSGVLKAQQQKTSSGHVWLVELPEDYRPPAAVSEPAASSTLDSLQREIVELRRELRELRDLLRAATLAAPASAAPPRPVLPWLQRPAADR